MKTMLDPNEILKLMSEELEKSIRPSGFQKNKAKFIIEALIWMRNFNYDFDDIKQSFDDDLRRKLLELRGIGDETADVLLLYVFEEAVIRVNSIKTLYRVNPNYLSNLFST